MVALDSKISKAKTPVERAEELGVDIAKKAKAAKITKVVFDRNGYLYAGKIKVVADAGLKGGLPNSNNTMSTNKEIKNK